MKKLVAFVFFVCTSFFVCSYADVNADPLAVFKLAAATPAVTCPLTDAGFCTCWSTTIINGCLANHSHPPSWCTLRNILHAVETVTIPVACQGDQECITSFNSYIYDNPAHAGAACPQQ